jgi:hypothetical protein
VTYQHPLPWTLPDRDCLHLEPDAAFHDGEPKPYKVRIGPPRGFRPGTTSHSVSFTEAELRSLYDQIGSVLDAPFRVLVLGGVDIPELPDMVTTIRHRLDVLHSHHPRMEVTTRCQFTAADVVAERWCEENRVQVWFYGDVESMLADGGNRVQVVLDAFDGDNWDENVAAMDAGLSVDWVRCGALVGSS